MIDPPSGADAVDAALADLSGIRSAYQPIVDLNTGTVVGFEALARWPTLPFVESGRVFDTAADRGVLADLDWACRTAALTGAVSAGMSSAHTLFVNIEPHTMTPAPDHLHRALETSAHLDVVCELTERSLLADPAALLTLVDEARRRGYTIALDDVGATPESLSMLEFVAPEIVKLDRSLVRADPNPADARTVAAVRAHVECTGAVIVAEGIETPEQHDRAKALGATLGQGWLFGRPAPLPPDVAHAAAAPWTSSSHRARRRPGHRPSLTVPGGDIPDVPSDLFETISPTVGGQGFVSALARQIEDHAQALLEPLTILSTFHRDRHFDDFAAARYQRLAEVHPFVAALGAGLGSRPAVGVRGAALDASEPFAKEWSVVAVGHHYFAALIARTLSGRDGPEAAFEFVLTHDRRLVVAAARSLMRRVLPLHTQT